MIVPFGGKKEKDHLKKGLKKAGYKTQDADKPGDDAQVDEASDLVLDKESLIKHLQQAIKQYAQEETDIEKLSYILQKLNGKTVKTRSNTHFTVTDEDIQEALRRLSESVEENFADGKKKGKSRPGRVKKSGASCNGSVTSLRKRAKNASGEKAKMYHWCANMKGGKK